MIDPALPPQNTETFRFPKCLAATARRSVKFFPYPVGRTAKTYRPAALQPSKHPNVWGLALNLENRVFKSKTQHGIELNVCTAHMKNKSDLQHAQLTRGPDSGLRNRILPDLASSSLFPSPSPYFLSSNRQNKIWGRGQRFVMGSFQFRFGVTVTVLLLVLVRALCFFAFTKTNRPPFLVSCFQ